MTLTLDHTIVPARDKEAVARLFAQIFGHGHVAAALGASSICGTPPQQPKRIDGRPGSDARAILGLGQRHRVALTGIDTTRVSPARASTTQTRSSFVRSSFGNLISAPAANAVLE